jgi:hypothetical protein
VTDEHLSIGLPIARGNVLRDGHNCCPGMTASCPATLEAGLGFDF